MYHQDGLIIVTFVVLISDFKIELITYPVGRVENLSQHSKQTK